MDAKEAARLLLGGRALAFNVREPYTFASGIKSPVYMDCRLLISDVGRRRMIADAMAETAKKLEADLIAATASAGIPWGAWVAERLGLPLVYVRGEAKDHGKGRKVEGRYEHCSSAVVVEDLVSTGGSSIDTVDSLRAEGVLAEHCVCIFTYGMEKARMAFQRANVELHPLSDFNTAADEAVQGRYLTADEAAEAKRWAKDPERWRK